MKVLVTGATGFVGRALVERLARESRVSVRAVVRGAVRRESVDLPAHVERVAGELDSAWDWRPALADVTIVVHLAARVHVMRDRASDPLTEYRRVNVAGTEHLARSAVASGVRRFVFLSSVKVNGEAGTFQETDTPHPVDPYGVSKLEAEGAVRTVAAGTSMDAAIIRAPLVYGPNVGANFGSLIRAVQSGVPLPFGAIHNRRSLVALDNLVDFIVVCMEHHAAVNETFLVSDGEDVSTADLVRRLAHAAGRSARLIPVPPSLLALAASLAGRHDVAQRLMGTLCVDITKAHRQLAWVPPVSLDEGLRRACSGRS